MTPTLEVGDVVMYKTTGINIERGDIVTALNVVNQNGNGVINVNKRVAGLPDDSIFVCDFDVYINGKSFYEEHRSQSDCIHIENIELKGDEYYLLGENKFDSYDSRFFGLVDRSSITAVAIYKVSKNSRVIYF
ncbi:hypothetical protein TUM3792_35130 [Shewanella sp. MBTL60-007]|nr:hypothetical protein TUM3792_35130 [Shewanella sp. MBTL60-007]